MRLSSTVRAQECPQQGGRQRTRTRRSQTIHDPAKCPSRAVSTVTAVAGSSAALRLGSRERAVLAVLLKCPGRIIDRDQLRREAGLDDLSPRRCDALLVSIRRALGPNSIVTVRRRGWMLTEEATPMAADLESRVGA